MSGPWRDPDAETEEYPGLVVHDGRHSGSVTVGRTRLPLNAIVWDAVTHDWESVVEGWMPQPYFGDKAISREEFVGFLYGLLEQRGEFARLLLVLADVERREGRHRDYKPWWRMKKRRKRVADQLRLCLAALDDT